MSISPIDTIIIAVYLVGIISLGVFAGFKKNISSEDQFLGGRSLRWPVIGAGLFCANISSIHLVGLASSGYQHGMVIGNFEWMASFCLILLGMVFAPFYFRSKITTLPEYVEKRYSSGARTFLAAIFIMSALLVHIGISMYAGAKVLEAFFGINFVISIIGISVATAIYTILGGLKGVMITDTVQAVLLLLGAALLTFFGLQALGDVGITSWAQLKEAVKPEQLSMIQPIGDPEAAGRLGLREYSWYSILFGYPILGIWYWCTDQTIVQKILSAKTEKDGRDGAIFAGFLKILPVFVMVLPGVIGYVLFKEKIGEDNDSTLMVMMTELLPVGVRGLMAAGLLAALMSTIAAALNSVATLTAEDIFKRLRPEAADHELVKVGRITAAVVIVLAMLWSSQGAKFGSIFEAINKIPMAFAPGITTIFLFGVFWKRGNRQGAMAALMFNVFIGLIYLCIDIPLVGTTQWINKELGIPFMQVGWYLFLLSSVIYVTVSLLTPAPAAEKTEGLCWSHPLDALRGKLEGTITDPRVMAGILLVIMIILYTLLH
ncbi:sodium:glucose symporter [Coraliomargarita sinensis]|uniref:Sodium:glucose symporter n=1 Tax=Coraliomargarita sinensis TaxID=2174842 RepID=A0A317ZLH3_9BACT|nr:sodium:solute symporter [Coraliomargarita sinensis]PXA05017.1 sodium:glucose symporter [Coraliomargarita sinensis]